VRPHAAVFGKKDAQQLACLRRMTLDLNSAVEIVGAPIVRDPDGLALSSRNGYLSVSERSAALAIPAALRAAQTAHSAVEAITAARAVLHAEPEVALDYLALVHPTTLAEVGADSVGDALLLVSARVGGTRLIDNVDLVFAQTSTPDLTTSTAAAH
jgi:pantoate--beta-alanine ligase